VTRGRQTAGLASDWSAWWERAPAPQKSTTQHVSLVASTLPNNRTLLTTYQPVCNRSTLKLWGQQPALQPTKPALATSCHGWLFSPEGHESRKRLTDSRALPPLVLVMGRLLLLPRGFQE